MDIFLQVDNLSLDVPMFLQPEGEQAKQRSWQAMLLNAALNPPRRHMQRLLDGINFKLCKGDRVGLLGVNGAGKSTLLRVLNGVYLPSSGEIAVSGIRQALLNLSLGFNNEATVHENIFLRGTAMGMKAALIRDLVAPILAFSELEEKVSHRLRTLSSGQRMRLGFAIATAIQYDIILMDEWISTGDAQFVAKAKQRLLERVEGSGIMVLASHNLKLLQDICNRGMVLHHGSLIFDGEIKQAVETYRQVVAQVQAERMAAGG